MHKQSLERFDFDAVLLPYSYWQMQNPGYAAHFTELVEVCRERNVAIKTIKKEKLYLCNSQQKLEQCISEKGVHPILDQYKKMVSLTEK